MTITPPDAPPEADPLDLDCVVTVNGERMPDAPYDLLDGLAALDGLRVRWGRDTTSDQPESATCTFTVAVPDPLRTPFDLLSLGAHVRVMATGLAPPVGGAFDPLVGTVARRVVAVPSWPTSLYPLITFRGETARVRLPREWRNWEIAFAPRIIGGPIASWDDLPRLRVGDVWASETSLTGWPSGVWIAQALASFDHPNTPSILQASASDGPWPTQENPWPREGAWRVTITAGDEDFAGLMLIVNITNEEGAYGALGTLGVRSWEDQPDLDWTEAGERDGGAWTHLESFTFAPYSLTPPVTTLRDVVVFDGKITDLVVQPAQTGSRVDVTAADFLADLGNQFIGDDPWPVDTASARIGRILARLRYPPTTRIDPVPGATRLSYRDVDNQSALGLLQDIATSVDAVLWPAVHESTGEYLRLEDTGLRESLAYLAADEEGNVALVEGRAGQVPTVSACKLMRDDASWTQDSAEVITRVDVTWLEQTVDDEGRPEPTERHALLLNTEGEDTYGVHRLGVTTELVSDLDARRVGTSILARGDRVTWRASELRWDTEMTGTTDDAPAVLDLLDGTRRIGLPVVISDLPPWAPVPDDLALYIEGGTLSYDRGSWTIDLVGSPSGSAGRSAPWRAVSPEWEWDEVAASLSWLDLAGVTVDPFIT